ncbi:MAG: CIA30 family protein [Leeuwenhoekiella sp.]
MKTIFEFSENTNTQGWYVVNDVVMGGLSKSNLSVNKSGNGVFEGKISLKNNGGFASVQYAFEAIKPKNHSSFVLYLKGDGKTYKFRAKRCSSDKHSYNYTFDTSGDWQEVHIEFKNMIAQFRGAKLPMTNYNGDVLEQIGILFGNEKQEDFKLEINKVVII